MSTLLMLSFVLNFQDEIVNTTTYCKLVIDSAMKTIEVSNFSSHISTTNTFKDFYLFTYLSIFLFILQSYLQNYSRFSLFFASVIIINIFVFIICDIWLFNKFVSMLLLPTLSMF